MKIISALGGGGSTFVIQSLEKLNYRGTLFGLNLHQTKNRLLNYPIIYDFFHTLMLIVGIYKPKIKVLIRPDAFWTDFRVHKPGKYAPDHINIDKHIENQKKFLIDTRYRRSAGIKFKSKDLDSTNLSTLIISYIEKMQDIENHSRYQIVLLSCHWGEYGLFKDLNIPTVYLIRDPFNSLISHSKGVRHRDQYLKRGYLQINTKEWIDAYLRGPIHNWIGHAKAALTQPNAQIVQYDRFAKDWKMLRELPDIGKSFRYHENDIHETLTKSSIEYILHETKELCSELNIKTPII
jgi:hypothetical protein